MCSVRVARRVIVGGMVAGGAMSAGAQGTAEWSHRFDVYQRSADSARQVLMKHLAEVGRARVYPDTVEMLDGNVKVVTTPELVSIVRSSVARADSQVRSTLGAAMRFAHGSVISVRPDTSWKSSMGGAWVAVAEYSAITGDALGGQVRADVASIAQSINTKVIRRIVEAGSPAFAKWRQGPLEINVTTPKDWSELRLELVSSRTAIAPKCYAGDMNACVLTLGLRPVDNPVIAYYDSATRHRMVESWARSSTHDRQYDRCLAGSDSNCIRVLARGGGWVTGIPSSAKAREVFANQALALGGAGALSRLLASNAPIDQAFAAAAGVPIDSLIALWHHNIHEQGIASDDFTPLIGALSVGWILVLGAMSTRSSRWR